MKHHVVKFFTLFVAVTVLSIGLLETTAEARAGGGRSMGSRGARSYSRPVSPSPLPSQSRQQYAPAPNPLQQQAGGGFMRSMAGGLMGGMLGSMLFSSFAGAGAGTGGMGGSGGIGLFEIILLAGIGYLLYRFIKKKREDRSSSPYNRH
jgi:predicted lipid-binding transport protein (Tim44 family)